ncbi:hypothetical protein [Thioalkalivibrio sp. ALJ15]|uniref:hypothetical protein n=1 Tax=Thioalkalivibrio sp. ALJ15 TaxID=748652 RepID=UPI0003809BE1|nr:hypothetical protein [Thioalkalivibrio sp. ALJ15]
MALSIEELSRAREVVSGLLEELHLSNYTFDVEPRDGGWEIQIECAADSGWVTHTFAATREQLQHCDDARVRQQLLDAWAGPLAACQCAR